MLVVKFCGTGDGLEDQITFCSAKRRCYLGESEAGGLCDCPAQLVPDGLGDIPLHSRCYMAYKCLWGSLLGHQGVRGLDLWEGVGHGEQLAVSKDTAGKR